MVSLAGINKLDSISGIAALRGLGESKARKALPQLRPALFAGPPQALDGGPRISLKVHEV
jgi:hypothetical protein